MIHATVTGNVGKVSEQRTSQSGKNWMNFSVASTEKKDGPTTWIDVVCFDEQADAVAQGVQKGDRVVVTGRLSMETYEKKDGSQGVSLRMVADEVGKSMRWARKRAAAEETEEEVSIPF